jgi:isoquinoline 1-oxidoreductase subunit alpha
VLETSSSLRLILRWKTLSLSLFLLVEYDVCHTSSLKPMPAITLQVNGSERKVNVAAETPLLWVLRDTLQLTGTKFGCGTGFCGACTVHLDGSAVRSCLTQVSTVSGKSITTIEGLSANGLHPVQRAWIAEEVPQCGYCQTGQIMSATALLAKNPQPSDDQITQAMNGNLCRCGTYERIRKAIHRAAGTGGGR